MKIREIRENFKKNVHIKKKRPRKIMKSRKHYKNTPKKETKKEKSQKIETQPNLTR